jgi:hypothetical protein
VWMLLHRCNAFADWTSAKLSMAEVAKIQSAGTLNGKRAFARFGRKACDSVWIANDKNAGHLANAANHSPD